MLERLADWGWALVLLVLGGAGGLFTRWISMLHKHDRQLAIIEKDMLDRDASRTEVVRSMASMNERFDLHRKESLEAMAALRRELREDFKTLIEFARRANDNR